VNEIRNVAIVGAGWTGLQVAKVLRDCGYKVSIFEELDDVGGTWHPQRAYHGLCIHTPAYRCQFHQFEDLELRNRLRRLASPDLYQSCRAYATSENLYGITTFSHRVTGLAYRRADNKCTLSFQSLMDGNVSGREYDFVISTQYNAPRLPGFDGQSTANIKILHSNEVKSSVIDDCIRNRRRVVLLGASKAATDLALVFVDRNYEITWVARKMYWFLNFDKGYFNHETGRPASVLNRWVYFIGSMLMANKLSVKLGFLLWQLTGMIHCPGKRHGDFKKFHHGWLDEHQIRTLRSQTHPIYSEIASMEDKQVVLKNGQVMPCDVLICATGCDPLAMPIALSVDGEPLAYEDIRQLYRFSVIPEIPRLCFTGFFNFGFGPMNGYHRAAWIMRYLEQGLATEDLREIAAREAIAELPTFTNPTFDSAGYHLPRMSKMLQVMLDSPTARRDTLKYVYSYSVKHSLKPFHGLDSYIQSRLAAGER
jgi:dimethylaniline monooxygenase (N-oxide forming)